ncbi:trehalose-phosphatase [Sarracenia purpurea var. burkii]
MASSVEDASSNWKRRRQTGDSRRRRRWKRPLVRDGHGMDIEGPATGSQCRKGNQSVLFQPAREFLPMIEEVHKTLLEKIKSTPGAKVENNKFCVSVHFRCVDEKSWTELAEQVRSVLNDYPKLKLTQGRKVNPVNYYL